MNVCWYDRNGQEIDVAEANKLLGDMEYKVVARHQEDGYTVSTVWLGLDHGWNSDEPLIFETMIFPPDSLAEEYCDRYPTEAAAVAGHERAITHLRTEILGGAS